MIEGSAPGQHLLVGWNVAVVTGVGNVVIAQTVKVHGHCVPTLAGYARDLGAVEIGLEAGPVADVQRLVCDVEGDLSGKKRSGLDTSAERSQVLKSE